MYLAQVFGRFIVFFAKDQYEFIGEYQSNDLEKIENMTLVSFIKKANAIMELGIFNEEGYLEFKQVMTTLQDERKRREGVALKLANVALAAFNEQRKLFKIGDKVTLQGWKVRRILPNQLQGYELYQFENGGKTREGSRDRRFTVVGFYEPSNHVVITPGEQRIGKRYSDSTVKKFKTEYHVGMEDLDTLVVEDGAAIDLQAQIREIEIRVEKESKQ